MNHAVIIGSGAGGLAAAVLLAQRGWRVTVLEQHYRAGGCLHRFFRAGVGFDTGFHYVGSAAPDQSFGHVIRHLGVADHIRFRALDPDGFDLLRFPELDFLVPVGLDRWEARLCATFPHEVAGIRRYLGLHRAAAAAYGLYALDPSVPPEASLQWEARSLASVLAECFVDPRIRAVIAGHGAPLYGVGPTEAPFGVHAVVTDHFLSGAYTVQGGGDHLAQVLVARVRALGGEVRLRTPVESIRVEAGEATGVVTGSGETIGADLVVANVHPKAVLPMLPAGALRSASVRRIADARPGRAHFGIYLRVRGDLSPLARRNLYRFRGWDVDDIETNSPAEMPFYFLTSPGARGDSEGVVLGLFFTDWAHWAPFLDPAAARRPGGAPARSSAYLHAKATLLASAIAAVQRDFPSWEINQAEASTPLSMAHYTWVPDGATYGHHHAVDQMGRYRLPMWTRVKQLVHVGQAVSMPGICGAMMSAYLAVGGMFGVEAMIEELRSA